MNKLKQYTGLLNQAAPKDHSLAYITEDERNMLVDAGGQEKSTPSGILSYQPPGGGETSLGSGAAVSGGGGPPGGGDPGMTYTAPSQPSGPYPHDLSVVDPYGNIALEQEKMDVYEEPTQANLLDLYMQYGAIPNAFRLGKAGLEKLGELGSGLQEKAMTWSLENRIKSQMKNLDLDNPNSMNNPKLVDLQIDLQGVKDGTFTQTDFTEKYGSGDVSDQGGGDGERQLQNLLTPYASYAVANQTPEESQVDKWFASNQTGTGLSTNYMNTYNTAKAQIANTLGMVDTSNQFGYSSDPYGGLTAQNLATNPYNIDWMQQRGLI